MPRIAGGSNPVGGQASATAPAAAASLIGGGISAPPGTYDVTVAGALTGTAETATNNVGLYVNGTLVVRLFNGTGGQPLVIPGVVVPGSGGGNGTIDLRAVAAATGGAIYTFAAFAQTSSA